MFEAANNLKLIDDRQTFKLFGGLSLEETCSKLPRNSNPPKYDKKAVEVQAIMDINHHQNAKQTSKQRKFRRS